MDGQDRVEVQDVLRTGGLGDDRYSATLRGLAGAITGGGEMSAWG